MQVRGLVVRESNGKAYRMAGSQSEITDRKLAEERLLHGALHDSLTGLLNRALILDRVVDIVSELVAIGFQMFLDPMFAGRHQLQLLGTGQSVKGWREPVDIAVDFQDAVSNQPLPRHRVHDFLPVVFELQHIAAHDLGGDFVPGRFAALP